MLQSNFIPNERQTMASMKIRRQRIPKCPLWHATHPNPGIRKIQRSLAIFSREAAKHSEANLFRAVGMLAENKSLRIHACAVCLVLPKGRLSTVATHNFDPSWRKSFNASEKSIVAEVYRSKHDYYAPDVANDPNYCEALCMTKSQFTVPIFWEGELVAILNVESAVIDGFSEKARDIINALLPSLIPDLLVLRSIKSSDHVWCPWHPDVHGWDLGRHLERMCREVATMICPTTVKMAVWYPDFEKDELTVAGTYGYDWNYVSDASLRLSTSQIGQAILSGVSTVQKLDISKFVQQAKAARAGIKEAYAVNVPGSSPTERPYGVITCYLTSHPIDSRKVDSNVRDLALQAIEYCAYLCSRLMQAYIRQKQALAIAKIQQAIAEHQQFPLSTRYEVAATTIRKVLRAPMQSTFFVDDEAKELRCVQTTGFCQLRGGRLTRTLKRKHRVYSIEADDQSHTVQCFKRLISIRRTLVGNTQEKGLPENMEFIARTNNAEFDPDETIKRYHNADRSLICVPLIDSSRCVGVMRVVRGGYDRAFTHYDTKILEKLVKLLPLPSSQQPQHTSSRKQILRIAGVVQYKTIIVSRMRRRSR